MAGESSYGGGLRITVLGACLTGELSVDTAASGLTEAKHSVLLLAD